MLDIDLEINRGIVEGKEKWREIIQSIPSLNFKNEWEVKIIPPYGGAVARFTISKNDKQICSVYLDWYERLGIYGEPYYELYPFVDDIKRYSLKQTQELLNDIDMLFMEA